LDADESKVGKIKIKMETSEPSWEKGKGL